MSGLQAILTTLGVGGFGLLIVLLLHWVQKEAVRQAELKQHRKTFRRNLKANRRLREKLKAKVDLDPNDPWDGV